MQADGDGFLSDVKMAKTTDQAEAIKLSRFFLEPADQQHLPVKFEHLVLGCFVTHRLGRADYGR